MWGTFSKVPHEKNTNNMKTIGIICECNPFHGGHEYLIRRARESGAEAVVCVMSGCFVQRGEAAILDAHTRAEMLLGGGADVVLELPYPFSAASGEHFARAGVEILDRLGVDQLWFGSECGDIDRLTRLAEVADSEAFQTLYESTRAENSGTAEAYFACLKQLVGEDVQCASNDILGISYLRAIRVTGAQIVPVTVKREGSAYADPTLGEGYPSATALRRVWREKGAEAILPYLPKASAEVLSRDLFAPIADLCHAERLILGHFRLTPTEMLEKCAELAGGLGGHMAKQASAAGSLDEFLSRCATKKYTNARLQRGILFALTGIGVEDLRAPIAYVRLLGATQAGCRYLAEVRRSAEIPVITRHTDLQITPDAARQAEWARRAEVLYALCYPVVSRRDPWKQAPIIR